MGLLNWLLGKNDLVKTYEHTETFTYFIPAPPERNSGYREKELDSLSIVFSENEIDFKIVKTINHQKGFWCIFLLSGKKSSFEQLSKSLNELSLTYGPKDQMDLELIYESDDEFKDGENFKV